MEHDFTIIQDAVVIFGLSIGVILLCHKVNAPAIVGFLITGVLAGPHGLGLVHAVEEVEVLAEIGVIMLLFVIGMELSFDQLSRLKKVLLVGGGGQVGLTIGATYGVGIAFGLPDAQALFIGFLVALSSTAIVLTLLQERAEIDTPHGRISLSILIFQDLIIVPMMLMVPLLAGGGDEGSDTVWMMFAKMVGVFAAVTLLAKVVAPRLFPMVVRTRSRELFLLTTLTLCFAVGWLTSAAGLSLALGAFMAGIIVAESDYSHHALEGILPFRDVFTNLFFVSVGMLLNLSYFFAHLPLVLGITLAIFALKAFASGGAALMLGYPVGTAMLTGLALAQVGEFSFVLAGVGRGHGLLTDEEYQLFLAASVATMAATPFVIQRGRGIAARFIRFRPLGPIMRRLRHRRKSTGESKVAPMNDHLIIIGFGVVGRHLARAATVIGIPYTIIEMNPDTVSDFAAKGESISYGDATRDATLNRAGILKARALVIAIADPTAARQITQTARSMNPALYIATRTRFMSEIEPLRALGADDVASEEFITSIEIFTRVMGRYLTPQHIIDRFAEEVRAEGYAMLRATDQKEAGFHTLRADLTELDVVTYTVTPHAAMDGTSLAQAGLRGDLNITVMAIRRNGDVVASPGPTERFRSGDRVYLLGRHHDLAKVASRFTIACHPDEEGESSADADHP